MAPPGKGKGTPESTFNFNIINEQSNRYQCKERTPKYRQKQTGSWKASPLTNFNLNRKENKDNNRKFLSQSEKGMYLYSD